MVLELLADDIGKDGMAKLMRSLADKVTGPLEHQFQTQKTSVDKLHLLAKIMNDLGYRAAVKQSDLRKGCHYRSDQLRLPLSGQTTPRTLWL